MVEGLIWQCDLELHERKYQGTTRTVSSRLHERGNALVSGHRFPGVRLPSHGHHAVSYAGDESSLAERACDLDGPLPESITKDGR